MFIRRVFAFGVTVFSMCSSVSVQGSETTNRDAIEYGYISLVVGGASLAGIGHVQEMWFLELAGLLINGLVVATHVDEGHYCERYPENVDEHRKYLCRLGAYMHGMLDSHIMRLGEKIITLQQYIFSAK